MKSRRQFLQLSAAGAALLPFTRLLVPTLLGKARATAKSSGINKPVVVSTWDFGVAANEEAWKVLSAGGRALDAVVAVGVISGEAAELVAGEFGGLAVVRLGLFFGGVAGERPELEQGAGRARAVQVPVADDRALVCALGPAVMRVQVLDELRAGGAQRDRPGVRVAVRVAGIGEDVAERDLLAGHRGQHGGEGADRVVTAR